MQKEAIEASEAHMAMLNIILRLFILFIE